MPTAKIDVPEPKKHSSLRAINQGTRYDLTGQLRRLARAIERGEEGEVRNILIAFTSENGGDKSASVKAFHYGTGTIGDAHWIASTVKNRLEPA